jgi:membrane protein
MFRRFRHDNMSLHAVAFAYYAFASVFPLLLLALAILGHLLRNRPDLQQQIVQYIFDNVPNFGSGFQTAIQGIIAQRVSLGLLGLVGLLWAGTGFAGALQQGFRVIWGCPSRISGAGACVGWRLSV